MATGESITAAATSATEVEPTTTTTTATEPTDSTTEVPEVLKTIQEAVSKTPFYSYFSSCRPLTAKFISSG